MSSRSNAVVRARRSLAEAASRASAGLRRALAGSLLRNGLYIMGTTATTSLLGFGFWLIAAHLLSAATVGRAVALVSAMLFVSVITNLGVGQVLVSRLGSRTTGEEWSLTVTVALALTATISLLGGAVAVVVIPAVVAELAGSVGPAEYVLLPLGVAAVACSLVLDFVCIAERRAKLSFVRNTAAAMLRLALIGGAAIGPLDNATWLLAVWVGSFLVIDLHTVVRVLPAVRGDFRLTMAGWSIELKAIRVLIAGHQSINLGSQASAYLLPVIVSARLGATENAYFYAAFMLATGLFFVAPAIGNSLFAEAARDPDHLGHDVRQAARYIVAIGLPPAVILLALGPQLLGLFGPEYASSASTLLYVLIGSAVFDAGYQICVAVLRAQGRLRDAAVATWTLLVVGIASCWLLLPPMGLVGGGVGWAAGKAAGLLVATAMILAPRRLPPGSATGRRRA
jgi:O-antigen/teichoic acid export membrane protein